MRVNSTSGAYMFSASKMKNTNQNQNLSQNQNQNQIQIGNNNSPAFKAKVVELGKKIFPEIYRKAAANGPNSQAGVLWDTFMRAKQHYIKDLSKLSDHLEFHLNYSVSDLGLFFGFGNRTAEIFTTVKVKDFKAKKKFFDRYYQDVPMWDMPSHITLPPLSADTPEQLTKRYKKSFYNNVTNSDVAAKFKEVYVFNKRRENGELSMFEKFLDDIFTGKIEVRDL